MPNAKDMRAVAAVAAGVIAVGLIFANFGDAPIIKDAKEGLGA